MGFPLFIGCPLQGPATNESTSQKRLMRVDCPIVAHVLSIAHNNPWKPQMTPVLWIPTSDCRSSKMISLLDSSTVVRGVPNSKLHPKKDDNIVRFAPAFTTPVLIRFQT